MVFGILVLEMVKMELLSETLQALDDYGKSNKDVKWVGSADGKYIISWNAFEKIAVRLEYNNGFGGQEIASDLVIVGKNWWLERSEYDGSEAWEFKAKPSKSLKSKNFDLVKSQSGRAWRTIEQIEQAN